MPAPRVPLSTIVMCLVVAVPFGLAIRDTLRHEDPAPEPDDLQVETPRAAPAEQDLVIRDERAAREARRAAVRSVLGAEPATLGPAFANVALEPSHMNELLDAATKLPPGIEAASQIDTADEVSMTIRVRDDDNRECGQLGEQVRTAWGPGVSDVVGERTHWVNPVNGQRAVLSELGSCKLVIEHYVTPEKLISDAPDAVIPRWAIGQPVAKLVASLPHPPTQAGDEVGWFAPGVGAGLGTTQLTARIKNGKVVRITAAADATSVTVLRVTERISSITKLEPTGDAVRSWASKPPIFLEAGGGYPLFITVGARQ